MKNIFLYFFLLISPYSLSQLQQKKIDSLELLLKENTSDSLKIERQMVLASLWSKSNSENAKKLLHKSLTIVTSKSYLGLNKYTKKAEIFDVLGIIEKRETNYDQALSYYLKSLKIKEQHLDTLNIGRSYHNIAMLFNLQSNYIIAEQYMYKAMLLRKKYNDSIKYAKSVNLYGYIKYKQKQIDSALYYYKKAKIFFNKDIRVADVNRKIAFIFYDNKQYNKALHIFEENLNIFHEYNLIERKGNTLFEIATTKRKTQKYQQAKDYLIEAEKIALITKDKRLHYKIYLLRYKIAMNESNSVAALEYYQMYRKIKDTVYDLKKTEKIKALVLNYEYDKERLEDRLNNKLNQEKLESEAKNQRIQKQLYITLFILSLVGFFSILMFYQYRKKLTEKEKIQNDLNLKLLNSKLESINNYALQLEVDNKMRFQFKTELINKIKIIKQNADINNLQNYQSLIGDLQKQIDTEKRLSDAPNVSKVKNTKLESVLVEKHPNLTKLEREICHYILLGLSNKEIINIRNASLDSVKSARYRIRKKMNVQKGEELETIIKNLTLN